jgi:hypothetical protein
MNYLDAISGRIMRRVGTMSDHSSKPDPDLSGKLVKGPASDRCRSRAGSSAGMAFVPPDYAIGGQVGPSGGSISRRIAQLAMNRMIGISDRILLRKVMASILIAPRWSRTLGLILPLGTPMIGVEVVGCPSGV